MTLLTVEHIWASHVVLSYEIVTVPIGTRFRVILVTIRPSSKVLPVVSIDAESLVVRGQIKRAPHGFVMEHVEIGIEHIVVDQFGLDLIFIVSKRAILCVLALRNLLRIFGAEFLLVLILPVELFDIIVRTIASISVGTKTSLSQLEAYLMLIFAHIECVVLTDALAIHLRVIVWTLFVIMLLLEDHYIFLVHTFLRFEEC